jgi:hypothetical protein
VSEVHLAVILSHQHFKWLSSTTLLLEATRSFMKPGSKTVFISTLVLNQDGQNVSGYHHQARPHTAVTRGAWVTLAEKEDLITRHRSLLVRL